MSALESLLALTPEQIFPLVAATGGLWATAWLCRVIVKMLK